MATFGSLRLVTDVSCVPLASLTDPRTLRPSPSAGLRCSLPTTAVGRRLDSRTTRRQRPRGLPQSHRGLGDRRRLASRHVWQRAASDSESTSTVVRDSSDAGSSPPVSPSNEGASHSEGSPPHSEAKSDVPEGPQTKDVVALQALDAYFLKLKGPEKKEEEKPPAPAAAASSTATAVNAAPGSQGSAGTIGQEKSSTGTSTPEPQTAQEKEIMDLLKKILDTKPGEEGDKSKPQDLNSPSFQMTTFGMPSPYQQWMDAQLSMNPPSALNVLLAINVAVFLFELASPEAVPGLMVTSLPSLLGAKVNALISAGEWWRLVTPMFLHAGFFHILLGSVVLLSLGPGVEVAFGSVGFACAYLVGGVFGNLTSFLQTADVTVGGTGPIFGILGAYLVYLWKNKDSIGKEEADSSFWSLVFFGALNIALGSSLPVDDWTHIGACLGGILFGALAAPTLKRMPMNFTKLKDVLKAGIEEQAGKSPTALEGAGKGRDVEPGGTLFLLEGPGPKRQAWIAAACLGVAALLLQLSTTGIPQDLVDLSDQMNTFV